MNTIRQRVNRRRDGDWKEFNGRVVGVVGGATPSFDSNSSVLEETDATGMNFILREDGTQIYRETV